MTNIYNKSYEPKILQLFKEKKLSAKEIASELNLVLNRVRIVLRQNNIDSLENSRHKPHDPEKELDVIQMYYDRIPLHKIAFITKVRIQDIPKVLERHNVKLFNRRKRYKLNEEFFEDINTPIKAMVFGVFYSDGSIHEERCRANLTLAVEDKDLVEFVKKQLDTDHRIFIRKNSGDGFGYDCQDIAVLNLQSKKMMLDLKRHGCIERKSLIKEWPNIDSHLIKDFTYGYFLGNGCIYKTTTKTGHTDFTISISSNDKMCRAFAKLFNQILGINSHFRIRKGKHPNCAELSIGGNQQVRKFVEWMMEGQPRAMERKNKLIDEFLDFMKDW